MTAPTPNVGAMVWDILSPMLIQVGSVVLVGGLGLIGLAFASTTFRTGVAIALTGTPDWSGDVGRDRGRRRRSGWVNDADMGWVYYDHDAYVKDRNMRRRYGHRRADKEGYGIYSSYWRDD